MIRDVVYKYIIGLLVGLALVSCAPQTLGSRGNPQELSANKSLRVTRGSQTFFKVQAPVVLVDRATRDRVFANDFKDLSQISPGRDATAPVIWFKLGAVQAPNGVKFEFIYQEAKREVQRPDSTTNPNFVSFFLVDSATIISAVNVAPDAPFGSSTASLEIASQERPSSSVVLPFRLEITDSSSK
jgi:hypothetical protein